MSGYDGQREADFDEDEEMPATERELAEDAQWKVIQKNTFTRWTNEHLKTAGKVLNDLEADLNDGLRLIALVEVLSGKKFKHINKRPNFRTQKLENVTMALKFLEDDEGIKIVNIDSGDIVDSRLKLILGLIWTLILHYSISMPMWEGEDEPPADTKEGPQARLLRWIQSKVPDKPINNFTTDWNDGTAIGALVDAVAPGLCPDWEDWDPKKNKENAKDAMDLAEKWLDVPQLIQPQEIINPKVDSLSMMTYLAQYPNCKLKSGAPLRPRTNASRVRAYGPGLEPTGNNSGAPAKFTVETFSAGRGEVVIGVVNPEGKEEQCHVTCNNDRNLTNSCVYTPTMEGEYRVLVKFAGKEIPKSPYRVVVEGAAGDATKVTASGPGIEKKGVQATKKTFFEVFAKDAGNGVLEVIILDPHGHKDSVKPKITDREDGTYLVEYIAKEIGTHSVHISFAGMEIPNSPYAVGVAPPVDAKRCYATGRGVQPKGVRCKDKAEFKVHTEGAGQGELSVQVLGQGGVEEKVDIKKVDAETYACVYKPVKAGSYVVNITYGGQHITKSPFKVEIGPYKESRIRAFGPGLESGMCGKPADFVVETNGETGALGFQIEGPSQAKIDCKDNGDGSADVSYMPTSPGEYAVHILCDEEDIPNSPFMANIQPATNEYNPLKVTASGPGLEKHGVVSGKWAQFAVDTRAAGHAPLNITAVDSHYNPIEVQVHDNRDGTYACRYMPKQHVKHTIFITYGGCNIPNSPFRVQVAEPSNPDKVKVYGPGVEPGVKTFEPTNFFVDCKAAGPGDIAIAMTDERGIDVPLQTIEQKDGIFKVDYEPKSVGDYNLAVFFADKEIPSSPMKVRVEPSIDLSKVIVDGLEDSVFLESTTDFTVDCRSVTPTGEGKVRAIITNPSGTKNDTLVTNNGDGTYKVAYTPYEQGPHQIDVTYEGLPVPKSPFPVEVIPGCDPNRVSAYGPGLDGGLTNTPQTFTISTRGAGQGGLGLAIEGPSEAKMTCKDNKDGTCTVEYLPITAGPYNLNVKFADQHIPGSPFTVPIRDEIRPDKCRAYGPGLDNKGVRAGQPATFTVDCREAGEAPLQATFTDALGTTQPCDIEPVAQNVYNVTYYPAIEGTCNLDVKYNNVPIPQSPIEQPILPASDASKVRVTGDGIRDGVPASLPVSFTIDTRDAGIGDLDISIIAPDGRTVRPKVTDNGDGTYTITYTPEDIGRYTIEIKFAGEEVPGAPFYVNTVPSGDASKCQFTEPLRKTIVVGQECVITVDAAQAGLGNITCHITTPSDVDADVDIVDNGDGTFSIRYTPNVQGAYTINIKFGGQPVPQGTCTQQAVNPEDYIPDELQQLAGEDLICPDQLDTVQSTPGAGFNPVDFCLPVGPVFNFVEAEITMPSGKKAYPKIEDNKDGTVTIKYNPCEQGLHELGVKYNGAPIEGSPFKFYVDEVHAGYVTAYGPGLTYGVSGEPCNFTVVTKDAGAGGLALAVEGPSKCEIVCQDNKDGTCNVSYIPTSIGEYKVTVKFEGKHIAGSPFHPQITGGGRRKTSFSRGSEFSLKVTETDISDLSASIKSPSGTEEPCILKKLANGHLGISFTPHETGEHLVNVYRSGRHIANSPFKIHVSRNEIGNASKVKVYGDGLKQGMANQDNKFTVDTKEAGYGGLSLSIEGPSKADIECNDNDDGTCTVSYKPTEPGTYIINIKFADEHVQGSPFTVKIGGVSAGHVVEKITRQQACADTTHAGSHCELSLKIPGTDPMEMTASVTSPSGVTELCDIMDLEDDHYQIRFTPQEMGIHTVMVKYKDMHIPGSPFQFTVGPITEGGAHKVHAAGPGLDKGEVDVPSEFNIYTREAGAGSLSIAVEGPSKAEIGFEDRKDGSCGVMYTATEPGEYVVNVKFNGEHIPDSPFHVPVTPSTGDAKKVSVQSLQQKGLQVGKPSSFSVVFNGAKGHLSAKIVCPSGAEDTAIVQPIDETEGHYAIRFIPRENGIHYVHVYLDGNHIKGSPFRILCGKVDADPGMVHARGKGLASGETNVPNKFIVNTLNAGASTLAVTIDGPSKVKLDCKEIPEGYEFAYVPTSPGVYMITMKYGGNTHIVGSPFKANITGSGADTGLIEQSQVIVETVTKTESGLGYQMPKFHSDAGKCTAKGPGLKKSFMKKKAQFTVETKDAGQNMLFVGMVGPAGASPVDEINIKHLRRTEYQVNYCVNEKGSYMLVVKWGEDHISGSPFHIDVL